MNGNATNDAPASKNLLLSVCVPTYNRSHLLKVMLQCVLPQINQNSDFVEICISDNGSSDDTATVVEESRNMGPLVYSRNPSNLGYAGNVAVLTTKLARGEYIWLVGDDDLLLPGAVSEILHMIQTHDDIAAFHLNLRICTKTSAFPSESIGGFCGEYDYLYRNDTTNHSLTNWKDLIQAETDMCTAMFAHVVKRQCWLRYFQSFRGSFSASSMSLELIFPHTIMLGEQVMLNPSYYLGKPVLTVFFGTQSYLDKSNYIFSIVYPRLIRFFQLRGLSEGQLQSCISGVYRRNLPAIKNLWLDKRHSKLVIAILFLRHAWRYRIGWMTLFRVIVYTRKPRIAAIFLDSIRRMKCFLFPRIGPE